MRYRSIALLPVAVLAIGIERAGAHDLSAVASDETTIQVTGTISLTNGCLSLVGVEPSTPPQAPSLVNTATMITRLAHSGFDACPASFEQVPVEIELARPDRHPSDQRPEYVVNYTIIDGAPTGAAPDDGLIGEIVPVQE